MDSLKFMRVVNFNGQTFYHAFDERFVKVQIPVSLA